MTLPRKRVVELYTCRDLLPFWSPGFVSLDVLCDGTGGGPLRFRQRYRAMGREIDEVLTLLEDNLPTGLRILADNGGTLTRESAITFEVRDDAITRIIVHNTFSGEFAPHLVRRDLENYTQQFLETFKVFAERQAVSR